MGYDTGRQQQVNDNTFDCFDLNDSCTCTYYSVKLDTDP